MSTIKVNSIEPANAGSEDYFLARAWVNFNGSGTVSIRDSGNVSSITDNGTSDFTTNFTNSFAAASYAISGTARDYPTYSSGVVFGLRGASTATLASVYQTGSARCGAVSTADGLRDSDACSLMVVE